MAKFFTGNCSLPDAAFPAFPAYLIFPARAGDNMRVGTCQVLDKSGMIAPEGVINGYCILDTVYKGISIIMGFCQVIDLDIIHPKM